MKALVAKQFGTPPDMVIEDRAAPTPLSGHSIVRIHAALVNPLSQQVRQGFIPGAEAPLVLGVDGSGIVEESGTFAPGTRVAISGGGMLGVMQDGLQQELVAIEDARLFPLPDAFDLEVGAAFMVNFVTAHQAMKRVGKVEAGQLIVVSGASGAVGQALLQVGRALGARTVALVSDRTKVDAAQAVGATHVVDLETQNPVTKVMDLTGGTGAAMAFDTVGGMMTGQLFGCIRQRGAVISIGFAGGTDAVLDLVDIVVQEKRLLGYDVFLETSEELRKAFDVLADHVKNGVISPRIDSIFALEDHEKAYARLTSRQATGAILLRLN